MFEGHSERPGLLRCEGIQLLGESEKIVPHLREGEREGRKEGRRERGRRRRKERGREGKGERKRRE